MMTKIIRLIVFRILFAWWMIPMVWILGWPLDVLMSDYDEATDLSKMITHMLWYGD